MQFRSIATFRRDNVAASLRGASMHVAHRVVIYTLRFVAFTCYDNFEYGFLHSLKCYIKIYICIRKTLMHKKSEIGKLLLIANFKRIKF